MSRSVFRYAAESQGMVLIFGLAFFLFIATLLEVARKLDRHRDVLILCPFVSAGEQDDKRFAAAEEIHTIAGTVVDPHLRYAAAHRLHVARVADLQPIDARLNACPRSIVTQPRQPAHEYLGLPDLGHGAMYPMGYETIKPVGPSAPVVPPDFADASSRLRDRRHSAAARAGPACAEMR